MNAQEIFNELQLSIAGLKDSKATHVYYGAPEALQGPETREEAIEFLSSLTPEECGDVDDEDFEGEAIDWYACDENGNAI